MDSKEFHMMTAVRSAILQENSWEIPQQKMKWKQGGSGKQSLETRRDWIKTPEQDRKRGEQILENKVTRMRQKTLEPERG